MGNARSIPVAVSGLILLACGTGPDTTSLACTEANTEALAVGEHRVLNPILDDACVRLPVLGGAGGQYLYLPVATSGTEAESGVSAPYMVSSTGAAGPIVVRRAGGAALVRADPAAAFHDRLRAQERDLSRNLSGERVSREALASLAEPPPVPGDKRTFNVCSTDLCDAFVQATATAKTVGQRVAIFLDDAAPAGGYTDADLLSVRDLFDTRLYPIDTAAFGRESDIDQNGVVIVLLTPRVNALSPDCNSTNSVVLGFFFGADLLRRSVRNPGSNQAEIFYGLVPDPGNPTCKIFTDFARTRLPATFIHEFQHMISFNQHALLRGGSAEETWLNEGLSHFAEELGGRQIPSAECPISGSCSQDFLQGDLSNAFTYLGSPEDHFLIEPDTSRGDLAERGANWLFVRWLVDHFAPDSVIGNTFTRRLVATNLTGATNVVTQTGVAFSTLVPEWQMSNYLDDLPGFDAPSARLRYKTWNFRAAADSMGRSFPLVPDATTGTDYVHTGVLRAGSGRHVVVSPDPAAAVDLLLTAPSGTDAVNRTVDPRIGLVRIR